VPRQTELAHLADLNGSGAVITSVTADSIAVEGAGSRRISEPRKFESFQGQDDGTESHRNIILDLTRNRLTELPPKPFDGQVKSLL
jgi:hypothetical protein